MIIPGDYFRRYHQTIAARTRNTRLTTIALASPRLTWKMIAQIINNPTPRAVMEITTGPKRFKQISREVGSITDKTLSEERKLLEGNKLISRDVYDSFPPTVEYTLTTHGKSLERVIEELHY
ncbi:MAG: winged helix-turn-helix transcriptional regulator [Chryseolinea sp.]